MKYIQDVKKFNKIKEMANSGDEKAKDFLFNFMEMDDKQANEYLSTIALEQPDIPSQEGINTQQEDGDWSSIIQHLIEDENEAIDGYDKAIKFITNSHFCEDVIKEGYIQKLQHIKNEEIEHIQELKEIL